MCRQRERERAMDSKKINMKQKEKCGCVHVIRDIREQFNVQFYTELLLPISTIIITL